MGRKYPKDQEKEQEYCQRSRTGMGSRNGNEKKNVRNMVEKKQYKDKQKKNKTKNSPIKKPQVPQE